LLLLNAATNGIDDIEVSNVAVDRVAGTVGYTARATNGQIVDFVGDHSLVRDHDLVRSITLDSVVAACGRVDVVKMDIEGAEFRALQGATEMLRRHRPVMFLEFMPDGLATVSGIDGRGFLEFLRKFAYRFEVLSTNVARDCGSDIEAVLDAYVSSRSDHIDLLAHV
jgi:FkbM family methyltransferase